MKAVKICVVGAAGRMGQQVLRCVEESAACVLTGAVVAPGDACIGKAAAPGVSFTADILAAVSNCDVMIDFSVPTQTAAVLAAALAARAACVCGVTNIPPQTHAAMEQAAQTIPLLYAPNMSVGVAAAAEAAKTMARSLAGYDVEIQEVHHRNKQDAPSGTALLLGGAICTGRGSPHPTAVYDRLSAPRRSSEEIGFSAIRGGTEPGTHTVYFLGEDETITITHQAHSRTLFARGAVQAALWIIRQPAGRLYALSDRLNG